MADFIWTNSYPAQQAPEVLTALAGMDDVGFLFHCGAGRCFVAADTPLAPSLDGHEPVRLDREEADEAIDDAVERGAAFCGGWAPDDEMDDEPQAEAA
jgi:hypothetical protein